VNVRVVAATQLRLDEAVPAGKLRAVLSFRVYVFTIEIAPLRQRAPEIRLLVRHLAARIRPGRPPEFTAEALAQLASYEWPGNVRELANIVERLAIIGGNEIDAALVRRVLPRTAPRADGDGDPGAESADALQGRSLSNLLDDYERGLVRDSLARASGNVAEAARALQTDRANLYRRMKRLGIS
jgi:DNA-binding NtrC family response regulator